MATVTRKGQITLPKHIRDALGLTPGSEVEVVLDSGRVTLRKRVAPEAFQRWRGFLRAKTGGASADQLIEELRGERLEDIAPRKPREDRG